MVGKRKANAMMAKISKMAKNNDKFDEETMEYAKEARKMFEKEKESETKEEYFQRVMKSASSLDRVLEFLHFRKQADKLLPAQRNELVTLVRKELEIDVALQSMKLEAKIAHGEETPILNALGAKLGTSFANILAPPTMACILCQKDLKKHHEPTIVSLFTLSGPVVASKHIWRCRLCSGATALMNQNDSTEQMEVAVARDVHYGPDSYGNNEVILKKKKKTGVSENGQFQSCLFYRQDTDFMGRNWA